MGDAVPWGTMPAWLGPLVGDDPMRRALWKTRLVRVLIVINLVLAVRYITWRTFYSLNWEMWPFAIALLLAEWCSVIDCVLFGLTMWTVRTRGEPPPPTPGATVDVFVTTYNEPVELVRVTALASRALSWPHETWVLDDGDRPDMRRMAEELGVGYIVRGPQWVGRKRHAKAGNLINALAVTQGEFILVLDADQVPRPHLLDRVLGHFRDPEVAFVQTPHMFGNTPEGDPFGSDAPLFYGPIQAGKDGYNSCYFCGSNAVLRREAMMQVGVTWYAREVAARVSRHLADLARQLRRTQRRFRPGTEPGVHQAVRDLKSVVQSARAELRDGRSAQEVTWDFQRRVEALSRGLVAADLAGIRALIAGLGVGTAQQDEMVERMSTREATPLGALTDLLPRIDMDDVDEAEPVRPMATMSVTEDLATAMRLHSLGWRSVYHHEMLAEGLAPEDLRSALLQRLRWAQGTMQVALSENPLLMPGLTPMQRLLYFGTIWSYLSGFVTVVYIASPILTLMFGLVPVRAYSDVFFWHLLPFLIANQLLFVVIGWGIKTWRGQQYAAALFPVWIEAFRTAAVNVWLGRDLAFAVTPKTRQVGVNPWRMVRVQLIAMGLLVAAIGVGLTRLALGWTTAGPIAINSAWALYCLLMLSVVIRAASWTPPAQTPQTSAQTPKDQETSTWTSDSTRAAIASESSSCRDDSTSSRRPTSS